MNEITVRVMLAIGLLAPQIAIAVVMAGARRSITVVKIKHERVYHALDALGRLQLLVYVIMGAQIPWTYVQLPAATAVSGAVLFMLAGLWSLWCRLALGQNLIPGAGYQENHTLTTTGPYAWARHPMYASYFIAAIGGGLALGNVLVFALLLSAAVCFTRFTYVEEQLMRQQLPRHAYHDYAARTGKYLPSIRAFLANRRNSKTR